MITGPIKRGLRRVRVWEDEVPYHLHDGAIVRLQTKCGKESGSPQRRLAVEIRIDMTPIHLYGLLGGHFDPTASGEFTLSMSTAGSKEHAFSSSLAADVDEVYWGMPRDLADAVLIGTTAEKPLPCGTLHLDCAAHGKIGSNRVIFAALGRVLVSALMQQLNSNQVAELALSLKIAETASLLDRQTDVRL